MPPFGKLRQLNRPVFEDKKLANQHKLWVFHACVESVFLYNAELWTMNKTTENQINAYHRPMLRNTIDTKWPNKLSSEALYKTTKVKKWSDTIKKRHLRWYGHAVRLPAWAKQALKEAMRATKKVKGGQRSTWLKIIEKDQAMMGLWLEDAMTLAMDIE